MAMGDNERLTPEEAQAVISLWSRRQWERQNWPTVADVAEGLEISVAEAEALLSDVRTHPAQARSLPFREGEEKYRRRMPSASSLFGLPLLPLPLREGRRLRRVGSFRVGSSGLRLATAVAGLTGFFCLYLSRLLT